MVMSHFAVTFSRSAPRKAMVSAGNNESLVVAGSIVSFTENVGQQQREDVLNSTLFAQLAADVKYNRQQNQSGWYKYYDDILQQIGYIFSSFNTPQRISTSGTFTVSNTAVNYISGSVTDAGLDLTKSALNALSKLPLADKAIALFDNRSTANTTSGTFQLLVCDQAPNGAVSIGIGAFYFKASKYEPRYLWTPWSKDSLTLFGFKETMTLDEQIYPRDGIAKRLKDAQYLVSKIILWVLLFELLRIQNI